MVVKILTKIFIELPLYLVALAFPRRKDIWVFGAWFGNRYSDNSRYVYEYVCQNHPEIRAVWLTHRRDIVEKLKAEGKEAYLIRSLNGYFLSCRAAVAILTCGRDDVNRWGIVGAFNVQLWHGTPLKKIGKDDRITSRDADPFRKILRRLWSISFPFTRERYDMVTAPSEEVALRLASAFGVSDEVVSVTGYPRADRILELGRSKRGACCIGEIEGMRWLILYAPTHRKEGRIGTEDLFKGLNWVQIDKMLVENSALFLIKMHYYHRQTEREVPQLSRVIWLSESDCEDLNTLLPLVDILITDYSSVFFDFLLLDRPIIFLPLDIDEYVREDRELYEDYNEATPGPKCRSWAELIDLLDAIMKNQWPDEPYYRDLRRKANQKYNKFTDTGNCARVVATIFQKLRRA